MRYFQIGNHCVIVKGVTKDWYGIESLELDNSGNGNHNRYIPINYPFFEQVQEKIRGLESLGCEQSGRRLDTYWKQLVKLKWPNHGQLRSNTENRKKYEMLFVKSYFSAYQIKFVEENGIEI